MGREADEGVAKRLNLIPLELRAARKGLKRMEEKIEIEIKRSEFQGMLMSGRRDIGGGQHER